MNRGYIYFTLIVVLLLYLMYIYIPIIKKSKKLDKFEEDITEKSQY